MTTVTIKDRINLAELRGRDAETDALIDAVEAAQRFHSYGWFPYKIKTTGERFLLEGEAEMLEAFRRFDFGEPS